MTGSAAALSVLPTGNAIGQTAEKKRPNIVFIMTDDHASHALSCYGSKINKTPNLDRIAAEGMRFDNCFCTNSICAPCRAVILTGKYSHINGVRNNKLKFDGSQQTFPKLLQEVGYETAMIGKWHLKTDPTGFDYWNVLPGQGRYYNPVMIEMGERKTYTGYVTDIITDHALKWIKSRKKGKPFCLMYQHKAPHRDWEPGPKHLWKSRQRTGHEHRKNDERQRPEARGPEESHTRAERTLGRRVRAEERSFPQSKPPGQGPGPLEISEIHQRLHAVHRLG
jgi:arylsulfatase A-like enzyme